MKKQYLIIALVFLLLLIPVVLFALSRRKKNEENTAGSKNSEPQPLPGKKLNNKTAHSTYPLTKGSAGPQVSALQNLLNEVYGSKLTVDGQYGSDTAKTVKAYLKTDKVTEKHIQHLQEQAKQVHNPAPKPIPIQLGDVIMSNKEGVQGEVGTLENGVFTPTRDSGGQKKTVRYDRSEEIGEVVDVSKDEDNQVWLIVRGGLMNLGKYIAFPEKYAVKQ